jgi:hypothetical protein
MDDDQEVCAHCADQVRHEAVMAGQQAPVQAAPSLAVGGGGTAVLAPPMAVPLPETVTFRSSRPPVNPRLLLLLVPLAAIVVAGAGYLGHGPLANQFVRWGLSEPRAVLLPAAWTPVIDPSDSFTADLPAGSTDVFASFDPSNPDAGGIVGERVEGLDGTFMEIAWTDLGFGPEGVRAFENEAGMRELAERYAATRLGGETTVVRDVTVPEGQALDVVRVDGDDTIRTRFVLAGGRFYGLTTAGPDSGSRELDEAHQRMLASFDPKT